jgi:gamma-glutamyltranspeptidase/glutathione hydrolase
MAPGKRTYHTIIPGMITVDSSPASSPPNTLYASFGVMGGYMQPQGHMQVVLGLVDDRLDPQAALDRSRFCLDACIALPGGRKKAIRQKLAGLEDGAQRVPGQRVRAQPLGGQVICESTQVRCVAA